MIARYSTSLSSAIFITFGLLFLMQHMIANGRPASVDPRVFHRAPNIRIEPAPPPPPGLTKPPLPLDPTTSPGLTVIDLRTERHERESGPSLQISPTTPSIDPPIRSGSRITNGDLMPIVKVAPIYPHAAARRELEGHVIVEFTVTQSGAVTDVVVAESTNGVFERAAVEAAAKFKYRPRVVNGTAVEVSGVRNLIRFTLDQ